MPTGLARYQQAGDLHFITFSCYRRQQFLASAAARDLFERSLETMRLRYSFFVTGYIVMPDRSGTARCRNRQAAEGQTLRSSRLLWNKRERAEERKAKRFIAKKGA